VGYHLHSQMFLELKCIYVFTVFIASAYIKGHNHIQYLADNINSSQSIRNHRSPTPKITSMIGGAGVIANVSTVVVASKLAAEA
jgi:hypothetical protein